MPDLFDAIDAAVARRDLLAASAENIRSFLGESSDPLARQAVDELVASSNWAELDNRFFRRLAFGTGGLRSKTIGATVTSVEQGAGGPNGRPEHPCVGTFAMNYATITQATRGLAAYVKNWHRNRNQPGKPAICIAYDTRHFSREFANCAATVLTELGCDVNLFAEPRSTPELSFAVRETGSSAGINITASHNPPQYNGYKVYFEDGGQIVEPQASGIIAEVQSVSGVHTPLPEAERGMLTVLSTEIDSRYLDRLESLIFNRQMIQETRLSVVFSSLHGVGGVIVRPLLERLGVPFTVVESQEVPDGRFPSVQSPNPENSEALTLAIAQAEANGANLVIATDPDADRLGAAARTQSGELALLNGNQIGSLLAWYRAFAMTQLGLLSPESANRGIIIKTVVTSDLQAAIAQHFGLRCVETLTGFKYIGAKLAKYERTSPETLFVFGGEESHGYSGATFVRDKDANSAATMLIETAGYAASQGLTLHGLLDRIHSELGCFVERSESIVMDGASGANAIRALVTSYREHPPVRVGPLEVVSVHDFAHDDILDSEGDLLPKEAMIVLRLRNICRIAIRPSGTEPKIKYYLFAVAAAPIAIEDLPAVRTRLRGLLDELWDWIQSDAAARRESAS